MGRLALPQRPDTVSHVERKFQVFVSSTYTDLVAERQEVMQALLEMDCLPAGMEMFPAADEDQWTLIKEVIDECDYYIVIVGGRYGSVSAEGVSYTEMEYDYAVASDIPVLGFVHGNPDDIPAGKSELGKEAREKLDAFRAKVMTRMVKRYASPTELGSVVSRGLNRAIKRNPQPGWVRGDQAMTPEVRTQIAELKAALADAKREKAEDEAAARAKPTELNLEYEHGADQVTFEFHLDGWESSRGRSIDMTAELTYEWDEVIEVLGPFMIEEAPEPSLRERWDSHMFNDTQRLDDWPKLRSNDTASITDNSWGAIIVQLRALGVIAVGDKKRTPSDKSIYWKLTPAGDEYVVKLRAKRREEESEDPAIEEAPVA
ncbi:DUF4062 domain-containing protein [Microbacterium sp. NPDC089695]|uniref:DUF4062 domain-containing protein n=1 Tax=Microbacterium sp. NPDC089695 TaxID=3364198 RepID=UPI0037F75554